mgnify:CR=1 FL=1
MIIAQKPKMAPHIPQMKENIAKALHMEPDCLNIKLPQRRSWVLPEEKRELLPSSLPFIQEIMLLCAQAQNAAEVWNW